MKKFKIGSKVVVIADTCMHGVPYGTILTISSIDNNNYYRVHENGRSYLPADLKLSISSIEDIKKEIESEEKNIEKCFEEIETLQKKVDFLKEIGSDKFDENEYKIYTLLKSSNGKLTSKENLKLVADLFLKK